MLARGLLEVTCLHVGSLGGDEVARRLLEMTSLHDARELREELARNFLLVTSLHVVTLKKRARKRSPDCTNSLQLYPRDTYKKVFRLKGQFHENFYPTEGHNKQAKTILRNVSISRRYSLNCCVRAVVNNADILSA